MIPRVPTFALALSIVPLSCADVRDSDASASGGPMAPGTSSGGADGPAGGPAGDPAGDPPASDTSTTDGDGVIFDLSTFPDSPQFCELAVPAPCDDADDDPFHALGLGCPDGREISAPTFISDDPRAWSVVTSFGDQWMPREGSKMLVLSSGLLGERAEDGSMRLVSGQAQPPGGGNSNYNGDGKPLPAPIRPKDGSNGGLGGTPFVDCDGVNDCSGSLQHQWEQGEEAAYDLMWLTFDAPVPPGATGFSFDFSYFSAEFPEWVNSPYNDIFVIWAAGVEQAGNYCFVGSDPCTVTALWPALYQENDPELEGTGFDGVGGSTGWFEVKGPAVAGETMTFAVAVFDMNDTILDTTILLDNFQWRCDGCNPEAQDCGVAPEG